jgi:predicted DNA-binding transcriptional regulator AlpA
MTTVLQFPKGRFEPWVNKGQVAAYLGRSKRWVELMAREGLPSRMIGGRRAYRLSEVEAWVEERFG